MVHRSRFTGTGNITNENVTQEASWRIERVREQLRESARMKPQ